jgi:chloramphenicol 3-O phosphotransferase
LVAIIILVLLKVLNCTKSCKQPGTVIILNGPSVSGKSSIQREFQSLMMPDLWIKLGIDNLFDKPMPDITAENILFWQSKNPIRWIETTKDEHENSIITLFTGQQGEKVAYGMNSALAAYAHEGCNVIVDYIAYKKEWVDDLRKKLTGIKTYWVKVSIPLTVLEEREAARGTSPKGHGRSHYDSVYWDLDYDLEVYSDKERAVEIAKKIKDLVKL